ncbi:MAG TPA: ABC transporter substrate-binding protein [Gemmatimonadaceae bacterium]|nr:ABC transporter substrate-binding protein [Gemmatimonadaceae bacterium]
MQVIDIGLPSRGRRVRRAVWVLLLGACASTENPTATTIRVGWQVSWATQGQIAQTLQRTNALALNGLRGEFKGFSYGAPLNEAALAGEVDVLFTADQPAAALLARDDRWKIICRLMYSRVALYVPRNSPVRTVADLRGRTIAMPFGAASQRETLKALRAAGLDPTRDTRIVHMDISEQAGVIEAGDGESWGVVDAMAGYDPTAASFEQRGLARMLHLSEVTSVVMLSTDYHERHPGAASDFVKAFIAAYQYYATHQREAGDWFLSASRLRFDPAVLDVAAAVEPNIRAVALRDIDVRLTARDVARLQEAADFNADNGMVKRRVAMRDFIDAKPLEAALRDLVADPARVATVMRAKRAAR